MSVKPFISISVCVRRYEIVCIYVRVMRVYNRIKTGRSAMRCWKARIVRRRLAFQTLNGDGDIGHL